MLKALYYIFFKRKKPIILFWWLTGFLHYYCTICGRWGHPYNNAFNVEEKACEYCFYTAKENPYKVR